MLSALLACTGLVLRSNVMPAAVSLSRSGAAVRCSAAVADMDGLLQTLKAAADTKTEDPDRVVGALLDLEKLARAVSKEDDGAFSRDTLEKLNGSWRLVFTTGTVDTQKRVGKINYFPIKAVQSFNTQTSPMTLTNGIFAGDFALLQFYGDFEWLEDKRRLEFDFDEIAVLGFRIQLPKGGAAEIGASTGLGSKGNVQRAQSGKKAFFNWISADASIATARGGGGGLALWRRDTEMEARMRAEAA
jgi:hypothetical protein